MTTVSLSALLHERDESLMVMRARPQWIRLLSCRIQALDWTPARRFLLAAVYAVAGVLHRHLLVVAGLAALVVAAATVAPALAWVAAGASLLFLEVRRR